MAAAAFGLIAFAALWPLFRSPGTSVVLTRSVTSGALAPNTDLFIWLLTWEWTALTDSALSLFDANILPQIEGSLASFHPRFGHLPIFGPILALSGNPVLAHQGNLFANFALSGVAAYILLRHWETSRPAAFFGGLIYALCPARVAASATPELVAGQYLPLGLLLLERGASRASGRDTLIATLLLVWQASCALAYTVLVPVIAVGYGLYLSQRSTRSGAMLVALSALTTILLSIALLVPSAMGIAEGRLNPPALLDANSSIHNLSASNSWRDFLSRGTVTSYNKRPNPLAIPPFVGLTTLLLAVAGLAVARPRRAAVTMASLATISALMSFGPSGRLAHFLWWPIRAVGEVLPPGHLSFLYLALVSLLSGIGLHHITQRWSRLRWPLYFAAFILVGLEIGRPFEIRILPRGRADSVLARTLAQLPEGSLARVPFDNCTYESDRSRARSMFESTLYGLRPILNGFGELRAHRQEEIEALAGALPHPRAFELLRAEAGLRYVLLDVSQVTVDQRSAWIDNPTTRDLGFVDGSLLLEVLDQSISLSPGDRAPAQLKPGQEDLPDSARQVKIGTSGRVHSAVRGLPTVVSVEVSNPSDHRWPVLQANDQQRVHLVSWWEDENGQPVTETAEEHRRLPFDFAPGEVVSIPLCVHPPRGIKVGILNVTVAQGASRFHGPPARISFHIGGLGPANL